MGSNVKGDKVNRINALDKKRDIEAKVKKGYLFKKGDKYLETVFLSTKQVGAKDGVVIWEFDKDQNKYVTKVKELAQKNFDINQLSNIKHILNVLSYNDPNMIVCVRGEDEAMNSFLKIWKIGKDTKKKVVKKKDNKLTKFGKLLKKSDVKPLEEENK